MHRNTFANRLKTLMKERHISGQRIADALQVSQKTISRYATGENVPSEEIQTKILEVIAQIGGHPEDAVTYKKELAYMEETGRYGIQISKMGMKQETSELLEKATYAFSLLKEKNQQFVLDWFGVLASVEAYEIAMVEAFAQLPKEKQDFVIEELETVHLQLPDLLVRQATGDKIGDYFQILSLCKTVEFEDVASLYEKLTGMVNNSKGNCGETDGTVNVATSDLTPKMQGHANVVQYKELLMSQSESTIQLLGDYMFELLSYDERDWYFLLLVQLASLHDQGVNTTYHGRIIGDKVYGLLNYLEKMMH